MPLLKPARIWALKPDQRLELISFITVLMMNNFVDPVCNEASCRLAARYKYTAYNNVFSYSRYKCTAYRTIVCINKQHAVGDIIYSLYKLLIC